ncbi:MAG: acyl-CoA thioesterase [Syntrophales bacterium]|nr:acyl-CoA thioesterase [Syntrophales bacterium]
MEGKRVSESTVVMAQVMNPQDANPAGNVHGGVIMKLIDSAAAAVGVRHSRRNAVTASIDRLDFHNPVYIGDLLTLRASLNMVGKTSMEVGVRVEAENVITGEQRHTSSAYLTIVALGDDGKPMAVPPLILESDDEARRNHEAKARRQMRLEERKKERDCQENIERCPL